jgi:hypothetical protein
MRFQFCIYLAAISLLGVLTASAHHSHGAYSEEFTDLQGVVQEVHLVVPHSWIYLQVKGAKAEPEIWAVEATGKTQLQKIGVTTDYVKPGDTIKVRCHRLKDGSNGCLLGFLKAADGTVKDWDGNGAQIPTDF